ncbi:hypothetical protein [Rhodopseudomonas palustris]|nr:hypothetical protein [Rhodopseudomonas palustris]
MVQKRTGGAGFYISKDSSNLTFDNTMVSGFDVPVQIEDGAENITFNNLNISRSSPRKSFQALSTGYSGKEQFDPRREARKEDPFYGARLVVNEGAYKNLAEFDKLSESFLADNLCTPIAEIDPETGHLVHKLKVTKELPDRLCYAAYAVVNDLRNALDFAVCASCEVLNGRPAKKAYFPFAEGPKDLEGVFRRDTYSDIPVDLRPFLASLQTYPTGDTHEGGDDLLRAFAKIANPNKHQVPLRLGARNLDGVYTITNMNAIKAIDGFDPYWDRSKNEIVVAKTSPDGSCDYKFGAPFYISFADTGFLSEYPVSATLNEIMTKVDSIVLGLEAETARILQKRNT